MQNKMMIRVVAALSIMAIFMSSQAGAQTYPVTTGTLELSDGTTSALDAGGDLSISGGGFKPGITVTVTIESDPVTLGTAQTDSSGSFTFTGNIPANFANGSHTLKATGQDSNGTRVLSQAVSVSGGSNGNLPITGGNSLVTGILAASLCGVGALLVGVSRRSRLT